MNQQARMLKTLASLAVAMTATSVLLGWMDPSPPLPDDAPSAAELAELGESLVAEGIALRAGRWDTIEIVAGDAADVGGAYLAAPSRNDTHFLVGYSGRPSRTPQWVRQESAASDARTIRIEVARPKHGSGMSRVQWHAVRGLVASLHTRLSAEPVALPVLLQGAWATAYGLEPGTQLDWSPPRAANN
ncbi:MAG: hypothetical protein PVI86_02360 [Phycisphaerae bacterium]|jgi:hypothetical protein